MKTSSKTGGGKTLVARVVGLTDLVAMLPERGSRASADRVDVLEYRSYESEGWAFREWRLTASGVKVDFPLERWWSPGDAADFVIGRIRIKRCDRSVDVDLGDMAGLAAETSGRCGLTEILNIELEPAFLGQTLGAVLIRAALSDVPGDDTVVCKPVPSEYSNVSRETSAEAVASFYRKIGMVPDGRVPGYLIARRADLLL